MSEDPEPEPEPTYRIAFEAKLGFEGHLDSEHSRKAILKNFWLLAVLAVLVLVPPLLMWAAASKYDFLAGFPSVVVAWVAGAVAAFVGFKALVQNVTMDRVEDRRQ